MKPDPYDNPTRNGAVMRNLVANLRLIHVVPFLQSLTFTELVEWYWYAQQQRADAMERRHGAGSPETEAP